MSSVALSCLRSGLIVVDCSAPAGTAVGLFHMLTGPSLYIL